MKKIKLFSLVAAALFADSTMAQTTVFHWQMSGTTAPANGTAITATGGTVTPSSSTTDAFSVESAKYVSGTSADMQAKNGKGLKSGKNALYLIVTPETPLKAGDSIMICGYLGWKISSTAEQTGDVSASVATGTDKDNYAVGKMELTKDVDVLYLTRAAGKSTAISAIKIVRPAACTDAGLLLAENPDIEANVGETLTAPALTNPNNVVVTYASSDESVVKVAADGTLTSVGAGDAVITISAALQTVGDVLYCADELTYNVKIKSLSPVLEATKSALDFSLNAFETTKSAAFTVSGYNLTGEASVSTLPAGFTLDPATLTITDGAIDKAFTLTYTAEAAVEASNANLVFSVGTTSVTIALTYGKKAALSQTIVTDSTTWDWTKASATAEIKLTDTSIPSKNDTILFANYEGITNDETFRSDALMVCGEYLQRDSELFQGGYISFNAERKGFVCVSYSNTGSKNAARSLVVNGTKDTTSSANTTAITSSKMSVNAGKVVIMFAETADETNATKYARVYSITYTVDKSGDIGAGLNQVQAEVKAVKVIRDGQLLIIREGKTYTAQGVELQ